MKLMKSITHVVGSQQKQIDHVKTQMEESKGKTESGLAHVVEANEKV
jgi:t-SNARE complex subunit (syntaxin)